MYRLTGRLEQSQLADLFRAERDGSESVVIKLFHLKTSDAAYARVIGEVSRQLQPVPHEGIARVLDVGMVDGQLAIVRQDSGRYTLGLALQRLNTREVYLPPTLALAMCIELLDAVGAAHAAGVVHGALTPGNILLGADGRVSVADFGALTALQASAPLKKSFASRGRSSYRAPELNNGGVPTVAGDLYALGAITYELLTLREASLGNSTVSTRSERLPPPSRLVRRLHSRIDPVIMRALENAPARRHRSCADFAEGLREFLVASGGIPPREDLQKFVGELFPNEVQLSAGGPVPIERAFELTDISGVGVIEADDVEADERQSFSGGKVDDRTPTSDGLPVFTGDTTMPLSDEPASTDPEQPSLRDTIKTVPDVKAVERLAPTDWEAPAAAVPEAHAGPTPQAPASIKNRVRVVEDFAALENAPKAPPPRAPKEKPAKTIMTFAVPFKRDGDPVVPSYEELRKRSARQARVVSFFAAMILMITVGWATFKFVDGSPDPVGEIVSYLPTPIAREINARRTLPRPPPLPPIPGKKLKLADFDTLHPDKAFNPDPDGAPPPRKPEAKDEAPPAPPVVKPVATPQPKSVATGCHQASGKGLSALSVRATGQVQVEIDGKRVCGSIAKVAVTAGTHRVEITDLKTKREYVSSNRFEPGKTLTITPIFPNR